MKASIFLALFISMVSCNAQKKNVTTQNVVLKADTTIKDSVEFYEVNIEGRQKNYLEQLVGSWNIIVMKRQAMMEAEKPAGVYLTLNTDMTFSGFAGCNKFSGNYTVKGAGIKFENIKSTKMACARLEQEAEFLRLLQNTVSTYSVDNKKLLLRDGSSNVVFEGEKRLN